MFNVLYNIVRRKSDIIALVMATSPPTVMFRRDLICPRLFPWNALLLPLESVQLSEGHDKFYWNLQSNEKFAVSSLYNAIIQPEISVDKNKKNWKMKNTARN
jgi:hypothetical protein